MVKVKLPTKDVTPAALRAVAALPSLRELKLLLPGLPDADFVRLIRVKGLRRLDIEAFVGIPLAHLARTFFGWGPRLLAKAVVVGGRIPGVASLASLRRRAPDRPRLPAVSPRDPASIMYTTGSTGPAKPTLYSHRNLCNIFRLVHHTWRFAEIGGVPVDMPVFPAFFTVVLVTLGVLVFAGFVRWSSRPIALYRKVALVALALSMLPDAWLPGNVPGATWPVAIVLMLTHVAAWLPTVRSRSIAFAMIWRSGSSCGSTVYP